MMKRSLLVVAMVVAFLGGAGVAQAGLVATYQFNGNLQADQGGVPALIATDPLGLNGFEAATLYGHPRQVYAFNGNNVPVTEQAGLTFNNSSALIPNNNYSVEMVFEFTQRDNAWRRILDVENRQSDNGFYVDPSNNLDVFPVTGSSGAFTNNAYHHVVLTDASSGTVKGYLDGVLEFTASTTVMDINNPQNFVNFFLDNVVGGGQGEFSSGKVGLIRLYDSVLTDEEVANLAIDPFAGLAQSVPEPGSLSLVGLGFLSLVGYVWRRRRSGAASVKAS